MKGFRMTAVTVTALLIVTAAPSLFAANANGHFQATGPDGTIKNVEFNAVGGVNGGSGNIVFSGPANLPDTDEDRPNQPGHIDNLELRVDLDCVNVTGNRASVSGSVKQSTVSSYIGQRLLLTVEDNGGTGKFTWGTYAAAPLSWTPSDAERPGDAGWSYSWFSTDAERPDDHGVPTKRDSRVDCQSYPLSAFEGLIPASGSIQVRE
jgi:hypothetical protein